MTEDAFKALLEQRVLEVQDVLYSYLPKEQGYQKTLMEAINYSLKAGGKRLRPILLAETFRLFGGKGELAEPFLAAIEMIHTYSLVHDDLPAMDNDEFRRGKKTTWAVYGEAGGILAGDGLLNYAVETALKAFPAALRSNDAGEQLEQMRRVARALSVLMEKAGIHGMIGGQAVDVENEAEENSLTMEKLMFIHEHKTAALIQAAMLVGAILAGADDREQRIVEKCAYNIGIAFQIQDDILDVIGDSSVLGKPVGSDAQNGKQTYITFRGPEASKQEVERLSEEALELLGSLPGEHDFLEELIRHLINRNY